MDLFLTKQKLEKRVRELAGRIRSAAAFGGNFQVDCVKRAEDGNGMIVRVHGCRGKNTELRIGLNGKRADIVKCNLLEEADGKKEEISEISAKLRPFEVRSYRIVKKG